MSNDEYRAEQDERRQHGLQKRQERRLENATYTAAEVKVLTEAALRLGRKEAGEDIATAINVARIQHHWNVIALAAAGECARIAREVASSPPQGAPEPRTDPKVDSDLPPEPEAVREPRSECPGCGTDGTGLESHRRDCPRNPYAEEAP